MILDCCILNLAFEIQQYLPYKYDYLSDDPAKMPAEQRKQAVQDERSGPENRIYYSTPEEKRKKQYLSVPPGQRSGMKNRKRSRS